MAEWVGCLPLAVELLNRSLATNAITPRELLDAATASLEVRQGWGE